MKDVCFPELSQKEMTNTYTNSHTHKDDWGFVLWWKEAQKAVRTEQTLVLTLRAREGRRPPKEESEHYSLPFLLCQVSVFQTVLVGQALGRCWRQTQP